MDWRTIISAIVGSVLTAVVLGIGGLFVNFASNGALVRALGGMTQEDVAQYLKAHLKEYLPPSGVQAEDLKLDFIPGELKYANKDDHGFVNASVSQTFCHDGSFLIGGYCGFTQDESLKGAGGTLQSFGLNSAREFFCDWKDVPETFIHTRVQLA
jgi:hypothetical protein